MKKEHQLHRLILTLLFCIGSLTVGGFVMLLTNISTSPSSKLHGLITTKATPSPVLTVTFGDLQFSTPSATLAKAKNFDYFIENFVSSKTSPYDERKIEAWLATIAPTLYKQATPAGIIVRDSKTRPFAIFPGTVGNELDITQTTQTIVSSELVATAPFVLVTKAIGRQLSETEITQAEQRTSLLSKKNIKIAINGTTHVLGFPDIASFVTLPTGFNASRVKNYVQKLAKDTGTKPVEPELEIENEIVKKFIPPQDGKKIDEQASFVQILQALESLEIATQTAILDLPLITSPPQKSLASTNTLGIQERIGIGTSAYSHSIPNRVYNVAHTTARIHAKLIMPGEEFSFNKYLGEVSKITGFKQAYIIKDGQTVLGDGGGVCQVSSTLFRSILNAGLPITERRGHSYRVSYYEQNSRPGFDATVYSPHPDLRFTNDTGTAILINAVANSKNLTMYVELYGKSDGRKADILNYKQWDARPAPPAVYQDDPTLGPGKIRQVEFASPGLKTSFDYKVTYPNGEIKTKTYSTNYIPWRAVYLRGV